MNATPHTQPREPLQAVPPPEPSVRQRRLLSHLRTDLEHDPTRYVSCDSLIREVGGYSANNCSDDTHDSTARKELRADAKWLNVHTDYYIVSSKAGYKIATLDDLYQRISVLDHVIYGTQAEKVLVESKLKGVRI